MSTSFDLGGLSDGKILTRVVETTFEAQVTAVIKIGQGFYAHIYQVALDRNPDIVIVKCHQFPGRAAKEAEQLHVLRKHALVNVPEVYQLHPHSEEFPWEALSMAHVPGINASKAEFPTEQAQSQFVDTVVENLLAWHAVTHSDGFGELNGPFYETWLESYGRRLSTYHQRIHQQPYRTAVSDYVLNLIDTSYEKMSIIFAKANTRACLVHSDYNAWNMMIDPYTFQLTGIIDPIDAGWCDFEIDLFHLPNCRPELGLLERYLQEVNVNDGFWGRFTFYRFWDDVKHFLRMGWYDENRFRKYGEEMVTNLPI